MKKDDYPKSELTEKIIGVAIDVHKELGPGFVEKVYQRALAVALRSKGLDFKRECKFEVVYEGISVGFQVIDFVIEHDVLVELKAVSDFRDIHVSQVMSYLKATRLDVGLLLNFAKRKLEIKRVVLT